MTRIPTANANLAAMLKAWRETAGISAAVAAQMLGMSKRTYEGIEQGRGFRHAKLLELALEAFGA